MLKMTNNNVTPYVVPVSKISLSSLAVVFINFFTAFLKYNNIDASPLNICSFDFLILIILLGLNSIDLIFAHKGFKSGCIYIVRGTSIVSLGLSLFIIGIALGDWAGVWGINTLNNTLVFNGKLSYIHLLRAKESFSLKFVANLYLCSSFMQLLSRLFKFKVDSDIKKEVIG